MPLDGAWAVGVGLPPQAVQTGHKGPVNCICWLGDGLLATGGADGVVKTFNLNNPNPNRQMANTYKYHKGAVTAMARFVMDEADPFPEENALMCGSFSENP